MPELLDWRRVGQPALVARFVAATLRQGRLVGLPTESSYVAAAHGLMPEAVARLRAAVGGAAVDVAVSGEAAARDWLPALGDAGRRLAGRVWPGPLVLVSGEGVADGLATRLPAAVRAGVMPDDRVRLRHSTHAALTHLLRRLPGPLVVAAMPADGGEAFTVRQMLEKDGRHLDLILDDGPGRYRQPATAVEVEGDRWAVAREGALSAGEIAARLARRIVFVCTGNTCRSPLAEAICKRRLADRLGCAVDELPARGYVVTSAGLAAAAGMPAAAEAVAVVRARGGDLERHRSQPLTPELARQADHLLVMTVGHARALAAAWPEEAARAELLSPAGEDVADPIGAPLEVYEACARELEYYIEAFLGRILSGVPESGG